MSTSAERMRRKRAGEPHRPPGPPPTAPCGTLAAWRRHQRHGEPIDAACAEARRTWARANWARTRPPDRPEPAPPPLAAPPQEIP